MKKWEEFEECSINYLKRELDENTWDFIGSGGADSTSSDIKVVNKKDNNTFNIEAKYSPAQCGQFVIIEQDNAFVLTEKSFLSNTYTDTLIEHINSNLVKYTENNSNKFTLNCDKEILFNWVIEHYKNKKCLLISTSTESNGYVVVFPLEDIRKHFEISACVRKKKSGTAHLAYKNFDNAIKELNQYLLNSKIDLIGIESKNGKTIVKLSKTDLKKRESYFGANFFLSPTGDGSYFIKTLSKTNNFNVIFSVSYIGKKEGTTKEELNNLFSNL